MNGKKYDIIVIGSGSGGLSVGLFMAKAGFSTLMISKSDKDIGGDCLNDGCVPSKAFIHAAKVVHSARQSVAFGIEVSGQADLKKVLKYVYERQEDIREHENAAWLKEQGVDVALGNAHFISNDGVQVDGLQYFAKKIVIATGSTPKKLTIPGIEKVQYYDNESIFHADSLPQRLLVIGGGPIGIEIAQAMRRFGSQVTVVHSQANILNHDDNAVTSILLNQLRKEGIQFYLNSKVNAIQSANETNIELPDRTVEKVEFDAVFVAVGRQLNLETLQLANAGIQVKDNRIVVDEFLKTTNKNVMVCGDIAGDLMFSHAAEFHARLLLNNLLSPLNKKLNNKHLSWVTFTDPEVATFGYSEKQLQQKGIGYERLEESFHEDDRAVVDDYQYSNLVLFIGKKGFLKKQAILGGTMVAPKAGELIQELILANTNELSIDTIFNKIYPYPVATRINQKAIVTYKSKGLTNTIKKLLHFTFKLFS